MSWKKVARQFIWIIVTGIIAGVVWFLLDVLLVSNNVENLCRFMYIV